MEIEKWSFLMSPLEVRLPHHLCRTPTLRNHKGWEGWGHRGREHLEGILKKSRGDPGRVNFGVTEEG